MWIEIAGELINFNRIIKVQKSEENVLCVRLFTTVDQYLEYTFKTKEEVETVFFNILESIKSRPVDGLIE